MRKPTVNKVLSYALRGAATACVWTFAVWLLYGYEYLTSLSAIDNMIGVMPISLAIVFAACATALVWLRLDRAERAPVMIALAVCSALPVALMPKAVRGDWWLVNDYSHERGEQPDITVYAPFKDGSLAAKPSEPSTLAIEGDLPVIDGALALYPVYAAFAQATYDKAAFDKNPNSVMFTDTLEAYDGIISGARDVIVVAGASENQKQKAAASGVELVFTPIGKEAFVFVAGKTNPVSDLSTQQIKNVYSGKTLKWRTLGWNDGGDIIAFQRPEGSGSQTGLQQIMGKLPIVAPRPLPDKSLVGTNSLMKQVSVVYKGVQPALGYSYRFYAQTMFANPDAKILSVDGVMPTDENIISGAYPFTVQFYAVTRGAPEGNVKLLVDYMLSPQGQEIIQKTGYAPIGNTK